MINMTCQLENKCNGKEDQDLFSYAKFIICQLKTLIITYRT